MTTNDWTVKGELYHGLMSAFLAYVEAKMIGTDTLVTVPGYGLVSLPLALGLSTGVSAIISDFVEGYITPYLPSAGTFQSAENLALGPGLSGAAALLVMKYADQGELNNFGYLKAFVTTAIADAAADYLRTNYFPM